MKIEIDNLEKTYNVCIKTGKIKEKKADIELIKSVKLVAENGLDFIKRKSEGTPKDSTDWTYVFRDYYESLRGLIEAYLLFDGVESDNHQCNNAYLCFKHKELELNWEFFEIIRLKRNAINYRGHSLKYEDWEKLELNLQLHIDILRKGIDKRLSDGE